MFKAIIHPDMAKKSKSGSKTPKPPGKPSALLDTRVIYCGDIEEAAFY
jgi:hypothetical protein